jgi:zinc transport system permease protein
MSGLLADPVQRAVLAAVFVGLAAPAIGIYLVQRRLALMGDGVGHIALTGVALGFLLRTSPVLTAVLTAAAGAVLIEVIRQRGRTSGDVALAMLFYGGIAGGVLLIHLSDEGSNATLLSYLFGSLSSVSRQDIGVIVALAALVLAVTVGLHRQLFAVCQDEEFARVAGLPVFWLNITIAVTAAITVTVAMRVVGLLLVSALMVVPVATAQQLTRGFRSTMALALALGVAASVGGVLASTRYDVPPGASVVVLAIAGFGVCASVGQLIRPRRHRDHRQVEPPMEDDVAVYGDDPDPLPR